MILGLISCDTKPIILTPPPHSSSFLKYSKLSSSDTQQKTTWFLLLSQHLTIYISNNVNKVSKFNKTLYTYIPCNA